MQTLVFSFQYKEVALQVRNTQIGISSGNCWHVCLALWKDFAICAFCESNGKDAGNEAMEGGLYDM